MTIWSPESCDGDQRPETAAEVSEALTAALTYTGLRRLAQDRIARDVATAAESRATAAETTAIGVAVGAAVLFFGVLGLAVTVSRSISLPLRRLARAAGVVAELSRAELVRVADSDTPESALPKLASVDVDSSDEIGELAAAVNRVQATAALLLERQVSTRANVATMFANIARRTQNLVGRQLQLIDELERNERDPELLNRLYQFDHVATRLRRSADSLLVVSGTIDQTLSVTPTRLSDVIRSALAEIEGYRAVELGQIADVAVVADLVGDLRLLLAELLENATNFSPPGSPVAVTAVLDHDCTIAVVDHGSGHEPSPPGKKRTDAWSSASGWTWRRRGCSACSSSAGWPAGTGSPSSSSSRPGGVSPRRCASRPACSARPEASPATDAGRSAAPGAGVRCDPAARDRGDPERGPVGPVPMAGRRVGPGRDRRRASRAPARLAHPRSRSRVVASRSEGRRRYRRGRVLGHASDAAPSPQPTKRTSRRTSLAASADLLIHGGLSRRIPGTHLAEGVRDVEDAPMAPRTARDPEAERDALNEYLSGFARGAGDPEPELEARPTLAERHS